ncbi:MAG: alpha/beta fold hydrolase [Geodermatophilaceae bacterium]
MAGEGLRAGITAERIDVRGLAVNVLRSHREHGELVVLIHGNVSSSVFWQSLMLALPGRYRPLAVDLRGFGGTDPLPVDATRGLRDFADDVAATVDTLGLDTVHLVGWSMGGGVAMQYLLDHPDRVATLSLVAPVSPYGFGARPGWTAGWSARTGPAPVLVARTRTSSPGCTPGTPARTTRPAPAGCSGPSTSPPASPTGTRTATSPEC